MMLAMTSELQPLQESVSLGALILSAGLALTLVAFRR
jgi:hypothetical protein